MKSDGKSYPAVRKYLAWSVNSAGSLLRVAAFLIASITDSKDTCECVANTQERHSSCSVPLKNAISHRITKAIMERKGSPPISSEANMGRVLIVVGEYPPPSAEVSALKYPPAHPEMWSWHRNSWWRSVAAIPQPARAEDPTDLAWP